LIFAIFGCSAHSKNELPRNKLKLDWQSANRNCYRLLRVSWALARIFCFNFCGTKLVGYI